MHADACVKFVNVLKTAMSCCTGLAIPSMGAVIPSLAAGEVGSFSMALMVRLAGCSDSQCDNVRSVVGQRSVNVAAW